MGTFAQTAVVLSLTRCNIVPCTIPVTRSTLIFASARYCGRANPCSLDPCDCSRFDRPLERIFSATVVRPDKKRSGSSGLFHGRVFYLGHLLQSKQSKVSKRQFEPVAALHLRPSYQNNDKVLWRACRSLHAPWARVDSSSLR